MDILENEEEIEDIEEKLPEKPNDIDHDKLLEDEIQEQLKKKGLKPVRHTCSRCKNDLGPVDQWFNFGVKLVKFGYTMIPQPLCKKCFFELESWLKEFESKDGTV